MNNQNGDKRWSLTEMRGFHFIVVLLTAKIAESSDAVKQDSKSHLPKIA